MRIPRANPRVAPVVDAVCIVAFVLGGRRSHDVDGGLDWFGTVVWPFLVGWFVVALVTRFYTRTTDSTRAHVVTIVAGVALAAVFRGVFTDRSVEGSFVIVAALFLALTTFGWRAAAGWWARRRATATR